MLVTVLVILLLLVFCFLFYRYKKWSRSKITKLQTECDEMRSVKYNKLKPEQNESFQEELSVNIVQTTE